MGYVDRIRILILYNVILTFWYPKEVTLHLYLIPEILYSYFMYFHLYHQDLQYRLVL
jgi:hypothetical protein